MSADRDAVVVGAGPAGLAAAIELAARGHEVEVLEAEAEAGGHLRARTIDGHRLARGPQAFPGGASHAWWLSGRLGLDGEAVAAAEPAHRHVFLRGAPRRLPHGPASFVASDVLSLRAKARLLCEPLRPRGRRDDESVRDFFERRVGREVTSSLVAPFVSGIHAGDPDALEARSAFPRLVAWERESGSIARGALRARRGRPADAPPPRRGLWSFRGGLAAIPRAAAALLGARLATREAVLGLAREAGTWRIETPAGTRRARRVVLAVPPDGAARLLAGRAADLARSVPLAPVAVVHCGGPLAGAAAPAGYGMLVPREAGLRTLGIVYTSSLFPDAAPAGSWLQATYLGGVTDPGVLDLDDALLGDLAVAETRRMLGFDPDRGVRAIVRHPAAIPQFVRGHADRVRALREEVASLGGLALAGNWLDAVGLDGAIASGRRAAAEVAA